MGVRLDACSLCRRGGALIEHKLAPLPLLLLIARPLLTWGFDISSWGQTLFSMLSLAWKTSVLWIAPAIALGVVSPFLKYPSEFPRLWSRLAVTAALICLGFGVLNRDPVLLLTAAMLLAMGFFFRRSVHLDKSWSLLAACVALAACSVGVAVHNTNSLSVYQSIQTVINPPVRPYVTSEVAKRLNTIEEMESPDDRIKELEELMRTDLTDTETPKLLNQLPADVRPHLSLDSPWVAGMQPNEVRDYVREQIAFEKAMRGEGERLPRAERLERATVFGLTFWGTLGLLGVWDLQRRKGLIEQKLPAASRHFW